MVIPDEKGAVGKLESKPRKKPPYPGGFSVRNSHASPSKIALAKKKAVALSYRELGYSFARIAEEMGEPPSTVHAWVTQEIEAIPREAAKHVVAMELKRLDAYQSSISGSANKGDMAAIDECLRIADRRARLLGLYPDSRQAVRVSASAGDGSAEHSSTVEVVFVVPGRKANGHDADADSDA